MEIFFYRHKNGTTNFGDELNEWLWPRLLPNLPAYQSDTVLIGIGTLLNEAIIPNTDKTKAVFSSGTGYGIPPTIDNSWHIYCVRGPLTARALKLPKETAVTDGAILIRNVVTPDPVKRIRFSYFAHLRQAIDAGNLWSQVCSDLGITYIDPRQPIEQIINTINSTEFLITEALHGAIVADALRVPWIAVKTNKKILSFKWQDWTASLQMDYKPNEIPPLWPSPSNATLFSKVRQGTKQLIIKEHLRNLMRFRPAKLSSPTNWDSAYNEINHRLNLLRTDLEKAG